MVNLDPACEHFTYQPLVDIRDLIQLDVSIDFTGYRHQRPHTARRKYGTDFTEYGHKRPYPIQLDVCTDSTEYQFYVKKEHNFQLSLMIMRWVAKSVALQLTTAALCVRIQTSLKIINGRRSGRHAGTHQKNVLKSFKLW